MMGVDTSNLLLLLFNYWYLYITRKLCYRKDDRAMSPTHGCPENFRDCLTTPTATIPKIFMGFVSIDPVNVPTKFEVRSFIRSWDNRGYPKNLGSPRIRPRSLFSKILMGFYSDWPYMCPPNLKSIALGLPVPEIRWVAKLQTPNLEEGEAIGGWGWYCSKERW